MTKKSPKTPLAFATRADVVRLFGEMGDEDVLAVLALNPTIRELEQASAWADGEGDRLAREGMPQTPMVAAILDIVDRPEDEPTYLR